MPAANLPVIVGAGQYVNRSREIADAVEPLEMMATVALAAERDAGVEGLIAGIDSLQGVTIIPPRVSPLFENAIRANLGLSLEEHSRRLGALYERFSAVAATNPYAWFPQPLTADEITTVGPNNRMVCFPYPKRMNAIMEVNQAAALILTGSPPRPPHGRP